MVLKIRFYLKHLEKTETFKIWHPGQIELIGQYLYEELHPTEILLSLSTVSDVGKLSHECPEKNQNYAQFFWLKM